MSSQMSKVKIKQVNRSEAENYLRQIRTQVFIQEQYVPVDLEWDGLDETAIHLLVMLDNQPIACARIFKYQILGRMAVIKSWRKIGLGMSLLLEAIKVCKSQGSKTIRLSAQLQAVSFYSRAGFKVVSNEYLEANIRHVDMLLALTD